MSDSAIRISDVKSLKELASVLAYPLISIAYFLQTGPEISIKDMFHFGIPTDAAPWLRVFLFILFFSLKSLWASFFLGAFDLWVMQNPWKYGKAINWLLSLIFIGLGLMGLFNSEPGIEIQHLNKVWLYAFLAIGFSCLSQLDRYELA